MGVKVTGKAMALLQYGLPQVSSVCFRAEKVGWMAKKSHAHIYKLKGLLQNQFEFNVSA